MLSTSSRSDKNMDLAWTNLSQVLLSQILFFFFLNCEHIWWGLLRTLQLSRPDLQNDMNMIYPCLFLC